MKNPRTVCCWRVALMLLSLVLLVMLPSRPTPASASGPPYLALGDSLAFGYNPLLDKSNAANFVGYPDIVAQKLGLTLTNASCTGETSSHFVSLTGADFTCGSYRASYPLHVSYSTSQLDFAVAFLTAHPDTRLVTIDIGSNDVFLLQQQCNGSTTCELLGLPGLVSTLTANLATIYNRIRSTAKYQGQLVALTYYSPNYNDTTLVTLITALNPVLATLTKAAGGSVADGFAAFQTASAASGGDPCAAGLLIPLTTNPLTCDAHPSPAGQDLLAAKVIQATGRWSVLLPLVRGSSGS